MYCVNYNFANPTELAQMRRHHRAEFLVQVLTMLVGAPRADVVVPTHEVRVSDSAETITIVADDKEFLAGLPMDCRGFVRGDLVPVMEAAVERHERNDNV